MARVSYATTTRGLQRSILPMRLFEKAKQLGAWNPSDIDFTQDGQDWYRLDEIQRDLLLRLTGMFQAGEEAVTLDLLPLIDVIAEEGRLEEEMYLTTLLWEEAKHTDFFRRFLDEVTKHSGDLSRFHSDNYREIFYKALPEAMQDLHQEHSTIAQVRSTATFFVIVEGVLAETGYRAYSQILEGNDLMPGAQEGLRLLKQDEIRHMTYGMFLLSRLIASDKKMWDPLRNTVDALLPASVGIIKDIFASYEEIPFQLHEEDFVNYAMNQFQERLARLEIASASTVEEIYRETSSWAD